MHLVWFILSASPQLKVWFYLLFSPTAALRLPPPLHSTSVNTFVQHSAQGCPLVAHLWASNEQTRRTRAGKYQSSLQSQVNTCVRWQRETMNREEEDRGKRWEKILMSGRSKEKKIKAKEQMWWLRVSVKIWWRCVAQCHLRRWWCYPWRLVEMKCFERWHLFTTATGGAQHMVLAHIIHTVTVCVPYTMVGVRSRFGFRCCFRCFLRQCKSFSASRSVKAPNTSRCCSFCSFSI